MTVKFCRQCGAELVKRRDFGIPWPLRTNRPKVSDAKLDAMLEVLVEAKRWLPDAHKSTLGCPAIYDLSICNCYVKPLIEKIDAILGEGK